MFSKLPKWAFICARAKAYTGFSKASLVVTSANASGSYGASDEACVWEDAKEGTECISLAVFCPHPLNKTKRMNIKQIETVLVRIAASLRSLWDISK